MQKQYILKSQNSINYKQIHTAEFVISVACNYNQQTLLQIPRSQIAHEKKFSRIMMIGTQTIYVCYKKL